MPAPFVRPKAKTLVFLVLWLIVLAGFVVVLMRDSLRTTGFLWALACFAVGLLLGFLFGIPRVSQNSSGGEAKDGGGQGETKAYLQAFDYKVQINTNFEQISDWLTKIIVGFGLIQLQQIPSKLKLAAEFVSTGSKDPTDAPFAAAMILFFSVMGILIGYLVTRLKLTRMFVSADKKTLDVALNGDDSNEMENVPIDESGAVKLSGPALDAAKRIAELPLSLLKKPEDIKTWAKAQLGRKNNASAVEGYRIAVERLPNDPQLRLEYSNALYFAAGKKFTQDSREQLLTARELTRNQSPIDTRLRDTLYSILTYRLLYVAPPDGFQKAVYYGEEYAAAVADEPIPSDEERRKNRASIFLNLACARGQQAEYLTRTNPEDPQITQARDKALDAVRQVLAVNAAWKERVKVFWDPHYPGKDTQENDLEVFFNDAEFRQLLG